MVAVVANGTVDGAGAGTASGTISVVSDVDGGGATTFDDVTSVSSDKGYGTFTLSNGQWTYTLDKQAPGFIALDEGETTTDTVTFVATDGTEQVVSVTIEGAEDTASVSGTFTGSVTEGNVGDEEVFATGKVSIADPDTSDTPYFADAKSKRIVGGFGEFAVTNGAWFYYLDQSLVQNLDQGDQITDSFALIATDGTSQTIQVTINGSEDKSFVSGDTSGRLLMGTGVNVIKGSLDITDLDADDSPEFVDVATTAGTNGFGSFKMVDGNWSYTVNDAAVAASNEMVVYDRIELTATDGTNQTLTVAIEKELTIETSVDKSTSATDETLTQGFGTKAVVSGSGNDKIVAMDDDSHLDAGAGDDVVIGGIGDDDLYGGKGNDVLIGDISFRYSYGSDLLVGGKGDDKLEGRTGEDVFEFRTEDGNDTIARFELQSDGSYVAVGADFNAADDTIKLVGFGYTTYQELLDQWSQVGDDAVFSDQGTTITLDNVSIDDLNEDNFIF